MTARRPAGKRRNTDDTDTMYAVLHPATKGSRLYEVVFPTRKAAAKMVRACRRYANCKGCYIQKLVGCSDFPGGLSMTLGIEPTRRRGQKAQTRRGK